MARVVVENVRVDFPIYAMQRNLRTVLFERATGGLIQHEGAEEGPRCRAGAVRRFLHARGR